MNLVLDEYLLKPYAHVVLFLAITIVVLALPPAKNANVVYSRAGVIYALFILVNSIVVFLSPDTWSYFFISLLFSIIYIVVVSLLCSSYIKLTKVQGSGESAMVFLVIIYHPVALLLMIAIKWFVK